MKRKKKACCGSCASGGACEGGGGCSSHKSEADSASDSIAAITEAAKKRIKGNLCTGSGGFQACSGTAGAGGSDLGPKGRRTDAALRNLQSWVTKNAPRKRMVGGDLMRRSAHPDHGRAVNKEYYLQMKLGRQMTTKESDGIDNGIAAITEAAKKRIKGNLCTGSGGFQSCSGSGMTPGTGRKRGETHTSSPSAQAGREDARRRLQGLFKQGGLNRDAAVGALQSLAKSHESNRKLRADQRRDRALAVRQVLRKYLATPKGK